MRASGNAADIKEGLVNCHMCHAWLVPVGWNRDWPMFADREI